MNLVNQLLTEQTRRSIRNEKSAVNEPHRMRGIFWRDLALVGFGLALLLVEDLLEGLLISSLIAGILGGYIGATAMRMLRRAHAYRNGWLDGRFSMVFALQEAARRNMPVEEWLNAEMERTEQVIYRSF